MFTKIKDYHQPIFHWRQLSTLLAVIITLIAGKCNGACYFPSELQGSFITQGTIADNKIQYSEINITEDSIPIWGICHRRIENNVILMISSEETPCFRCFNLQLVSRNVLRVCTTDPDYISKCYTNEQKAIASCPSEHILEDVTHFTEIILYKHLEMDGQEIRREYCPINGRYKLNFNIDDGHEDTVECQTLDSELDNCPSGSAMNLRFRKCSFENHEVTFECLGHWKGNNNQKYMALMNSRPGGDNLGPQYRCAIYDEGEESGSGIVTISFSKDSTCSAINKHPISTNRAEAVPHHTETLTLYPADTTTSWPHITWCEFPEWMQGHWVDLTITNDTFVYRDRTSFKAYTMKCIEKTNDTIFVYSRTQCDEEAYQCIQIKYRSPNIIEIQIGSSHASNYTAASATALCAEEFFDDGRWLTQARLDHNYQFSPCPVSGGFTGFIPDAPSLCAKLSSECTSEDIMYYEVSACEYGEVYEERKYQCLGQWEENGLVYTYTRRLDVGVYECFVGAMKSSERQVFIKEAGEHCQRNMDPFRYGMELKKIVYCDQEPKVIHQRYQKVLPTPSEVSSLPTTTTSAAGTSTPSLEQEIYPDDHQKLLPGEIVLKSLAPADRTKSDQNSQHRHHNFDSSMIDGPNSGSGQSIQITIPTTTAEPINSRINNKTTIGVDNSSSSAKNTIKLKLFHIFAVQIFLIAFLKF